MKTKSDNQPTMPTLGSFTFAPVVAAAVALALEGVAASMHMGARVRLDVARIIEGSRPLRESLAEVRRAMVAELSRPLLTPEAAEGLCRELAAAARVAVGAVAFVRELQRQAEETHRMIAEAVASMPEDEREELRRAIEDAPLGEADVNASGMM